MTNFRGVILDVDGTLIDSNDAHALAWQKALAEHGFDVPFDKIRSLIGMGGDHLLPEVSGLEKESPEGEPISERWGEIFEEQYLPNLRPFPRTRDLVERMHRDGLKIVVATSGESEMAKKLLEIAGVTEFIEARTSSSDAERSKPDPDIVQAALDNLDLPAEKVVMIGDTPYDIEAAGKAGIGVIALRCGGFGEDALSGAIAVYDSPADLLDRYNDSPLGP